MSSAPSSSRNLFCVCYTDNKSGQRFYINYLSDTRKGSSIRLPQFMLEMSRQPETKLDVVVEAARIISHWKEIETSISRSLLAFYGRRIPRIYLTKDGKDLVMNVHVFKDHAAALKRLPLIEPTGGYMRAKWQFLESTMIVTKLRIKSALEGNLELRWGQISKFKLALTDGVMMPTGERVSKERISELVRIAPEDIMTFEEAEERQRMAMITSWPVKVGDRLFSFGWTDEKLPRSVFYNVVASDHPKSLRLAPFMLDIARSPTREEARALARTKTPDQVFKMLSNHFSTELIEYHRYNEPQVFVAKDKQTDLVFDVPIHIEHASLLPKCFPGQSILNSFQSSISAYYEVVFHRKLGQHDDREKNLSRYSNDVGEARATGRRATKEEIESLLFKEKGTQRSLNEVRKTFTDFFGQNDLRLLDIKDMTGHINNDFPY